MQRKNRCFSPLSALKSGNAKGGPGGNIRARFLGSFFAARQRMNIRNRYSSARDEIAQYERL
jgi:hypothetical protein